MRKHIKSAVWYGLIVGAAGLAVEMVLVLCVYYASELIPNPERSILLIVQVWVIAWGILLALIPIVTGMVSAVLALKVEQLEIKMRGLITGGVAGLVSGILLHFGIYGGLLAGYSIKYLLEGRPLTDLSFRLSDLLIPSFYIPIAYGYPHQCRGRGGVRTGADLAPHRCQPTTAKHRA